MQRTGKGKEVDREEDGEMTSRYKYAETTWTRTARNRMAFTRGGLHLNPVEHTYDDDDHHHCNSVYDGFMQQNS